MVRQIEEVYDEELVRAGAFPQGRPSDPSITTAPPVGRATLEIPPL
jgi:hypothetical protein